MLKMQKWWENVNFLTSYLKIVGILFKMKIMKKKNFTSITVYRKQNYSKLMKFILGGRIRSISFKYRK